MRDEPSVCVVCDPSRRWMADVRGEWLTMPSISSRNGQPPCAMSAERQSAMPPVSRKSDPVIEAPAEVDLGVLKDVIGFRIRRIQNHLSRAFIDRLNREEIRPGEFSALALIAANPGMSQTTLAREIGFDKATVVALLDSLERLGWAERRRSPQDRRRHALYVTPLGETSLENLHEVAVVNEAKIHLALTKDERAQLFGLLDKLYVACFTGEAI